LGLEETTTSLAKGKWSKTVWVMYKDMFCRDEVEGHAKNEA